MAENEFLRHDASSNAVADPKVKRLASDRVQVNDHLDVSKDLTVAGDRPWRDVRSYGAKGDRKPLSFLSISLAFPTTLNWNSTGTGPFQIGVDENKTIFVVGAGPSGASLKTTISSGNK